MSIANLEGIDVARTSVDDWEAALALLLCWAAYPRCRKELRAKLGSVGPNRSADLRRELFASRKSLEATISAYLDPACKHTLRLIRGLYEALFEHPSCSGAARATLCGNRWTDPIKYRTQLSVKIEERCFKVVTEYLSAYATEFMVEHLVEYLVKSDSEASQTLVAQPELQPSPISSVVGNRSAAMTQRPLSTPVAPAASPLPAHPLPSPNICGLGGALRNKRKVNEDAKLSPKVKRPRSSYTAHSSGSPGASSISISLASSGDSSGPSHKTISSALSSDSRGAPHRISSSASSSDSPSALHKTIASATPSDSLPKKRKPSQDEPPAGPSPKRRK
ncbi:hypothetical protein FBU31_002484 [Coemansia sp. 'formosensis']|nr:hypothetical protein FBU31_002484 [Coemansia sp. 'formosensis']